MTTINYQNIAHAISLYQKWGYRYIEVPWIVSSEAVNVTLPSDCTALTCQDGALVGSAEQSFIHLALAGKLTCGKYVAISPCFRDDAEDRLHQRQFMKVELIDLLEPGAVDDTTRLRKMLWDATDLFGFLDKKENIKRIKTEAGYDLELNGIEIGSYGIRKYQHLNWIYGTGLAEARFSVRHL